jgi:two-component system, chemotaxis family, protein-glutamate methylesterase/glutaminase
MNSFARDFPIVCVGGSAGGSAAFVQLLKHLPPETGAAIVIVNHLRKTPARLHDILPHSTKLPVVLITEGLPIQPNHVFIVPANCDLHLLDGMFRLRPISKPHGWPDVITVFMRSLAQNWGGKLVAVIVSGLDSDGAGALREIKEAGGITIAQAPDTAEWSDMPASAIKTGYIDYILPAEDIAQRLAQIASEFPGEDNVSVQFEL